jgi:hypothetical protein
MALAARRPPLRSSEEMFEDHLRLRLADRVDDDIQRNYDPDVLVLGYHGIFHGHEGVRQCASRLAAELAQAKFCYTRKLVCGEIAFLEWTATAEGGCIEDGVDTFLIRDGRIVAKTVRYTVTKPERRTR